MSHSLVNSTFVIQNALLSSRLARKLGNRLSVHGISFTEYLVMDYLDQSRQKAVPRIELADHIGMSASGVTRLLAPLEKNKIVEKTVNPRDARQSLVKLSKAGQRLYRDAKVSFEHITDDLLASQSQSLINKSVELYGNLL